MVLLMGSLEWHVWQPHRQICGYCPVFKCPSGAYLVERRRSGIVTTVFGAVFCSMAEKDVGHGHLGSQDHCKSGRKRTKRRKWRRRCTRVIHTRGEDDRAWLMPKGGIGPVIVIRAGGRGADSGRVASHPSFSSLVEVDAANRPAKLKCNVGPVGDATSKISTHQCFDTAFCYRRSCLLMAPS